MKKLSITLKMSKQGCVCGRTARGVLLQGYVDGLESIPIIMMMPLCLEFEVKSRWYSVDVCMHESSSDLFRCRIGHLACTQHARLVVCTQHVESVVAHRKIKGQQRTEHRSVVNQA